MFVTLVKLNAESQILPRSSLILFYLSSSLLFQIKSNTADKKTFTPFMLLNMKYVSLW